MRPDGELSPGTYSTTELEVEQPVIDVRGCQPTPESRPMTAIWGSPRCADARIGGAFSDSELRQGRDQWSFHLVRGIVFPGLRHRVPRWLSMSQVRCRPTPAGCDAAQWHTDSARVTGNVMI